MKHWATRALILAVVSIGFSTGAVTRAKAATCAGASVEARGEQSRFAWLAKTKARANWRTKVRRIPGLGVPFSVWAQAQNTEERCLTGPSGTVCIFSGVPCRR